MFFAQRDIYKGTAIIIAAAIFYGAANISIKLSADYLNVWQTAIGRFAMGVILIPVLAGSFHIGLIGNQRILLILRGIAASFGFVFLVQALNLISISVAMILFYLWPAFACLLSSSVAGERIKRIEWLFITGAFIGTTLVFLRDGYFMEASLGYLSALASSFFTGLAVILTRRLRRDNNPFTIYFYFCFIGVILTSIPLVTQDSPVFPASRAGWVGLLSVAAFSMTGQVLLNHGLKYLKMSKAGVLMMIEVLTSVLFGIVYLGESFTIQALFGSCLILLSSVMLIVFPVYEEWKKAH
ncbi:MAG: DMT family transporter [Deltaproteobacteria bacterium]|nr:DMT family transporter [Deltaproteobacteria bacterium]